MMIDFLLGVLWATWEILKDASVFLLFGFLLAGVLAVLVPGRLLRRLIGTGQVKSVLWASVLGAPLPLCSCGVLPTALGLRKQGATTGATVAFLVATPETGIDSISLTLCADRPDHDRVPAGRRDRDGDRRGPRHESVRLGARGRQRGRVSGGGATRRGPGR